MAIYAVKYNPSGEYIPGATQVGTLAVAIGDVDYTTGGWIGGVDDDLGYVIYSDTTSLNLVGRTTASFSANLVQPNMPTFYRSKFKTDESLLELINRIPGNTQSFNDINSAKAWLNNAAHVNILGGTYSGGGATGSGDFNVTITQVGSDVVWSGSGSFNLTDLTLVGSATACSGFAANQAIWIAGATPNPPGETGQQYEGASLTYPTTFALGTQSGAPSDATGSMFGVVTGGASGRTIVVPDGYVTGTTISGSTTYSGTTIADLGLATGTYTWSWGTGGNTSTLVMTIS
jgi:hypothetical protein